MPRYIALLRGINVGKAKRIAMADWRSMLAGLGFTSVTTVLNSGNAVLTADSDPGARIEAAITEQLGMDVRCVVLTTPQLRAILDGNPFSAIADNGSRMMGYVLSADPAPPAVEAQDPTRLDPDHAAWGPRVIYHWCPEGLLNAPPVGGAAEKHLGVTVTARNWNTLTKLRDLA